MKLVLRIGLLKKLGLNWREIMFKEAGEQELAISRSCRNQFKANNKRRGRTFKQKIRIHRSGGRCFIDTPHLDRKIRRCYPRGPAAFRMMDLECL